MTGSTRLAVDIGGTFTDLVLALPDRTISLKLLTTPDAPDLAVIEGARAILAEAGVAASALDLVIHGTTLATNALIERKGAQTALITTQGFRDSLEIAYEHRFEQYDLYMERPEPLVSRDLRLEVPERLAADGAVLLELDEAALDALVPVLRARGIEAVAISFLHSYVNPAHEERARARIASALPDVAITISSEVCREIREYERTSTTVANAYVLPLMGRYIARMQEGLRALGAACPLLMMMSSGGVCTVETARRYPVRLVESGPAGGAILARNVAARGGYDRALSFDMGGTTAKITLIDDFTPQQSRHFEVARAYRFAKGSGIPVRIPVIDMVEIGAGGGSIARVDSLRRIVVGPDSAGSDPGPACYARGGAAPTVTDADVLLGRIDPAAFAGGKIALDPARATDAVRATIAAPLGMSVDEAARGIAEIVDETMASAARVHAVENGKDTAGRTLIAFGGAAPLHAARLAQKLGISRVVIPPDAGVGSAHGFLDAPIAYEVVRTLVLRLDRAGHRRVGRAVRRDARRGRSGGAAWLPRGRPGRNPYRLHALSRSGPRGRRGAAGAGRRCRRAACRVRYDLCAGLRPRDPRVWKSKRSPGRWRWRNPSRCRNVFTRRRTCRRRHPPAACAFSTRQAATPPTPRCIRVPRCPPARA